MSLDAGLSAVIQRIYGAGDNSAEWASINDTILMQTGACASLRTSFDPTSGELEDFVFSGPETSAYADGLREYEDMKAWDPTLLYALRNPAAGFCDSSCTLPEEDYLSNNFIKWNRARFGSTHWYVCYSPTGERISHSLSIHISAAKGIADRRQITKLRMIFDHMEAAAWLNRHPPGVDQEGVWFVLNPSGRISLLSPAAEQVLSEADGLLVNDGSLRTLDGGLQARFENSLARIGSCYETGAGPAAMWITRPNGRPPWLLTVRPLTTSFAGLARISCGFHIELGQPRGLPSKPSVIADLFDLSPREAEVLHYLEIGHTVDSLSCAMGISLNTAKVHLRAIFAKTRTQRQAELLQLSAHVSRM